MGGSTFWRARGWRATLAAMRPIHPVLALLLLGGCTGVRSYTRSTPTPLPGAYRCAADELVRLGYTLELQDSVGGLVQGRREITGLVESARKGAAAATEVLTAGLAGGKRTRFDEITVFAYVRRYPQGNTLEVTAGMLTISGEEQERTSPTDDAKRDARTLLDVCAPKR